MSLLKCFISFSLVLAVAACTQTASNQVTDKRLLGEPFMSNAVVFFNGNIVTMDEGNTNAEAVAMQAGKIVAVGSKEAVLEAAGDNAQLRDLEGKTLLPGLIDAHGHISYTTLNLATANVSAPPVGPANNISDVIRLLKAYGSEHRQASWIIGWGYDDSLLEEQRHPTRDELDKVSTERPVMIRHVSGHLLSCNSRCLELAGIGATSEAPAGGVIRRIAGSKKPDGVLEETAMGPVLAALPMPDIQARLALLNEAQQYYAGFGITTVQDGAVSENEIAVMREAAAKDLLYLDVISYPYALFLGDKLSDYPSSLDYLGHYRIGGFKLVLDGSPQGKTAWLSEPYHEPPQGLPADYLGYASMKDDEVQGFVDYAFSTNTPMLAHANGDAAADQLIAAITASNAEHGNTDRRSVMIHAQTVRDDQIDAMLSQNIIPSYFVAHTFYWGDWHRDSVFGVERASRISPLRHSTDRGLRYTTHNDTPIVPPDMMRLLWAGVNRITRSGQVLGEAQRATVYEMLKSMTIDAAYQYFEEARKGSITVGKLADFVVLDHNPLTVEPTAIKDIQVIETIKEGKTVFAR